MNGSLKEEFRNPGADKRSIPFWSWNGKMDEEELRSQVKQMKQAGVGGFFIHSRIGLETDYLGEQWMNCVKAVVDEAKAQGLYAWLYDEDRWPSGTAGGRVTSGGDAYRCKGLTLEVLSATEYTRVYEQEICSREAFSDDSVGLVAVYRAKLTDAVCLENTEIPRPEGILSYERLPMQECQNFEEDEVLLVVRLAVSGPSEWFNHEAPPDNLNPDCVRRFINETHEKYKQAVGEEFGKTIPGIFTDEPSLNDRFSAFGETKSWIPWTYGFGEYFKQNAGYDFYEVLPLFYFHGEGSRKVRHDYWKCVARRYGESYFQVLGQWCEENNLLFTGHFLQEDKLGLSTRVNGAIMPNYRYQHVPGIDMLCEQTREYMTVKQCTSVASQLGKKTVLSETYGCTGWEFTFEGQKWMGDWQYVLGVNRRCQHLMLYSLRGCRKRDYPPSFNYNTNWWMDNKIVDDYFARLSVVLEQGEAVRKILLVHPVSTAWSRLGVNPYGNPVRRNERDVPGINERGDRFNELIEFLERMHLDCDLGDELLMEQFGSVESAALAIGRASYEAVVLAESETILESTCKLLLAFLEQGGKVYVLGENPVLVGGSNGEAGLLAKLTTHENWVRTESRQALAAQLETVRTVRIEDRAGEECKDVLYQLRCDGDKYYLFLVNNSRAEGAEVTVKLSFCATIHRMELLSGEIVPETGYENGINGISLPVRLGKSGSAVYYFEKMPTLAERFEGPFSYRTDRKNVLPLDMCRVKYAEGNWSETQEIWQVQKKLREELGMRANYHNGIEQRYKWIGLPHERDGFSMELCFTFEAEQSFEEIYLAMERPEDFCVSLNGEALEWRDAGYLLDKEIRKCKLHGVVKGENRLVLSCGYRNDMELENLYLEGEFGVRLDRCLVKLPEKLPVGNWTEAGFKHYCGSIIYQMEYQICQCAHNPAELSAETVSGEDESEKLPEEIQVWMRLPETKAICVKVRVNDNEIILPWDYERELSVGKWMQPGKNRIEVELVGSPRNMMGPFHLKKKPANTSDASFCPTAGEYCTEYLLEPYGLMGAIEIVRTMGKIS